MHEFRVVPADTCVVLMAGLLKLRQRPMQHFLRSAIGRISKVPTGSICMRLSGCQYASFLGCAL